MHCKHCGNQIENDSKFCSFCGGKVEPSEQVPPLRQQEQIPENNFNLKVTTTLSKRNKGDNGLLIGGLIFFSVQIFWTLWTWLFDNWYMYNYVENIFRLVSISIPFIFSIYVQKREYKIILLIASLVLAFGSIYNNLISFYVL